MGGKSVGPGYTVTAPFELKQARPMEGDLVTISGKQLVYQKKLQGEDKNGTAHRIFRECLRLRFPARQEAGAGVRVTGDRPLLRASVWSIRTVVAVEPFIDVIVEPGKTFEWKYT